MSEPSNLLSPASTNKRRAVAIGSSSVPNKKRRKQENLEEPQESSIHGFLDKLRSPSSDGEDEEELYSHLDKDQFSVHAKLDDYTVAFLKDTVVKPFCAKLTVQNEIVDDEMVKSVKSEAHEYNEGALVLAKDSMRMAEKARLHRKHGQAKCLVLSKEYEDLLAKAAEKKAKLERIQGLTDNWSQSEQALKDFHASFCEVGEDALKTSDDMEELNKMPLGQRKCAHMSFEELREFVGFNTVEEIKECRSESKLRSVLYSLHNLGFTENPLCPLKSINPEQNPLVKPLLAIALGLSMADIEENGFHKEDIEAVLGLGICADMSIAALRAFAGFENIELIKYRCVSELVRCIKRLKQHGFEKNSLCPLKKISPTMMRGASMPCMAWLLGFSIDEITAAGFHSHQMFTFHQDFVPLPANSLAPNEATHHQESTEEVEYAGTELGDSDWELIFVFRKSIGNYNQAKIASETELGFIRNMREKQTFLSPGSSRQINQPRSILRSSSSARGSGEGHARYLKNGSPARQGLSQSDQPGSMLAQSSSSAREVRKGNARRLKNGTPTRQSLSQAGLPHCPPHLGASSFYHYSPASREYDSDAAHRQYSARQSLFSGDADAHSAGRHDMCEEDNQGLSPKQSPQSPSFGR